jgi:hypothetical protein
MLVRGDLCALVEIYARSRRFMRVRWDLCAFTEIYARSWGFMRVHGDLCAFAKIYARPLAGCVKSNKQKEGFPQEPFFFHVIKA